MAYATLDELKRELGIPTSNTGDDALLTSLLGQAEAFVDAQFSARFEAVTATRKYGIESIANGSLFLDAPLLSLSTLVNGDGETISADDYELLPRNASPKYQIRLRSTATKTWAVDAEKTVAVTGTWGYTASAPELVKRLTLRLAAYYYRLRDAQVFDTVYNVEAGTVTVPKGTPADAQQILDILHAFYQLA
jgi:hypothetical protein